MPPGRPHFPLTLEFVERAKPRPEYLADVYVTIRNHRGHTVLKTVAQGPFLLARLAPGDYTVSAERAGQIRTDHLVLAANKPERIVFEWGS